MRIKNIREQKSGIGVEEDKKDIEEEENRDLTFAELIQWLTLV